MANKLIADDLNEAGDLFIKKRIEVEQVEVHPLAIVLTTKGVVQFSMAASDRNEKEYLKKRLLTYIKAMREKGVFLGVALLSEAWMSVQDKLPEGLESEMDKNPTEALRNYSPEVAPSQDPNRKEIAMVISYGVDGSRSQMFYDIIRAGSKRSLAPSAEIENCNFMVSWLEEAFTQRDMPGLS